MEQRLKHDIFKPMRKTITVEEMVQEQDYKGTNKEEFMRLVRELDIQEPLEFLLAQLKP